MPDAPSIEPGPGRRPTGKVASLPKPIRDEINTRLQNGATYEAICDWLGQAGHPAFNVENVANWYHGGFQQWLKGRERFEHLRLKAEARKALRESLAAEGLDLTDSNTERLLEIADEVLDDFDPSALKEAARDNPTRVFGLLSEITSAAGLGKARMAELELKVRKYEDAAAAAKAALTEITRSKDGGLTPETLARIEEAAGLL